MRQDSILGLQLSIVSSLTSSGRFLTQLLPSYAIFKLSGASKTAPANGQKTFSTHEAQSQPSGVVMAPHSRQRGRR
jgi:hypothetical protein